MLLIGAKEKRKIWKINKIDLSQFPSLSGGQIILTGFSTGAHMHWKHPCESRINPFSQRNGQYSSDGHIAGFIIIVGSKKNSDYFENPKWNTFRTVTFSR